MRKSGEIPKKDNVAQEFFKRVSFRIYRDALTHFQRRQLRAATLFSENVPVPVPTLEASGSALNVDDSHACLTRLIGLGLVDIWPEFRDIEHAALNPLARSLAGENLTEAERKVLAAAVMVPLSEAWQDNDGYFPTRLSGRRSCKTGPDGGCGAGDSSCSGSGCRSLSF